MASPSGAACRLLPTASAPTVAERIQAQRERLTQDAGGIGGTLAGNALSLAAVRATLEHVLTDAAYARTIPLAERFEAGVRAVIDEFALPWNVTRLGCRAEYWFRPEPAAQRRRGGRRRRPRPRPLHAPVRR